MNAIVSELVDATGIKAKGDPQKYLAEMVKTIGADDFDEKVWNKMSTEAQEWVNAAMDEIEADEAITPPEGKANGKGNGKLKAKSKKAAPVDDDDEPEAEEEDDEPAPKAKKAKGKAAKAAKPAKAEKAAKGKAKPAKAAGAKRGRGSPPPYSDSAKITVLKKAPHREGTLIAERYAALKTGMTVGVARKAGLSFLDLKCDVNRGNLKIK